MCKEVGDAGMSVSNFRKKTHDIDDLALFLGKMGSKSRFEGLEYPGAEGVYKTGHSSDRRKWRK